MPSFVLHEGDAHIIDKIRTALGGSIPTQVNRETERYINKFGDKDTKKRKLKLKGVAFGKGGLIFTFDDGSRHVLEPGDQLSITSQRVPYPYSGSFQVVKFSDAECVHVRITKPQ